MFSLLPMFLYMFVLLLVLCCDCVTFCDIPRLLCVIVIIYNVPYSFLYCMY